jgi:hypothetical protein
MTLPAPDDAAIAAAILRLTAARGPERSICPSEVARDLAGGLDGPWRPLMGRVRTQAKHLARDGQVDILRKGRPLPAGEAPHGVIRLRAAGHKQGATPTSDETA